MSNNRNLIKVDGVQIKTPSSFSWGLQDVSDSAAGRTQDAVMHKNRIAQKVKLSLEWWNTTALETASILQAFNPEYISIKYLDPLWNEYIMKTFYVGDRSVPVKTFAIAGVIYSKISFEVIER